MLAIEAQSLGDALKWEPSRGGDLFPHLYGMLAPGLVLSVSEAVTGLDGVPDLGELSP